MKNLKNAPCRIGQQLAVSIDQKKVKINNSSSNNMPGWEGAFAFGLR